MKTWTYLYPARRAWEVRLAMAALGFGVYCGTIAAITDTQPLWWVRQEVGGPLSIPPALILASLIHATGIWVNGHWRWSPALRVIGMAINFGVFVLLAVSAFPTSGGFTYAVLAYWLARFGLRNAVADLTTAMMEHVHARG